MLKIKKQIAEIVIRDYESFINKNKKSSCERFKAFLEKKDANAGICMYLIRNYNIDISNKNYVKKYQKYTMHGINTNFLNFYWCKIPYTAETKKEVVECLQQRIDILKTWL